MTSRNHRPSSLWPTFLLVLSAAPLLHAQGVLQVGAHRRLAQPVPVQLEPLFPIPVFTTGDQPAAVALGDIDLDGDKDMAVANIAAGTVGVYRASGDHRFELDSTYDVPFDPRGLHIVDVSGDGFPDVVVAERSAYRVSVLQNTGSGSFLPPVAIPVGGSPNDIAVGDLDLDGDVDVVTPYNENVIIGPTHGVAVLLNNGTGTFAAAVKYVGGNLHQGVALGDFDADGDLDIASGTSGAPQGLYVYLNQGNGTFGAPTTYPAGGAAGHLRAADLDLDGDVDIAMTRFAASPAPGFFSVFVNAGGGVFPTRVDVPTGNDAFHIAIGDLDRDGLEEVLISNTEPGTVSVHRNQGGLTFAPPSVLSVPNGPWGLTLSDVQGDGVPELFVCAALTDHVFEFASSGNGVFTTPSTSPTSSPTLGFESGDLNGDRLPDLVSAHHTSGRIDVRFSTGTGGFTAPLAHRAPPMPFQPRILDYDQDGLDDILALNTGGVMSWLRNLGNGSLAPPVSIPTGTVMECFATADVDADGDLDVAGALQGNATTVSLMLQTGSGFTTSTWTLPANPRQFAMADLDGDGRPEVIVSAGSVVRSYNGLYVLWNLGGGVFAPPTQVLSLGAAVSNFTLIPVDFDRDGDIDLVSGSATNFIAENQGGMFIRHSLQPGGSSPGDVVVGDFDADGRLDVASTVNYLSTGTLQCINVHRGVGSAVPQYHGRFFVGTSRGELAAGDFDLDGDTDLALHTTGAGSLAILESKAR